VQEFHWQLFTNVSATLLRKIKNLTGMEVRDTTAEIEPTTGSVVQFFTTDRGGGVPAHCRRTDRDPGRGHSPSSPREGSARREANKTG
jgi:hypothetical protein